MKTGKLIGFFRETHPFLERGACPFPLLREWILPSELAFTLRNTICLCQLSFLFAFKQMAGPFQS